MKPNERLKALADAPLGRLVMRFSWPALVSMTLNALYSIVDRIYIGQGCGQDAMAGLTLVFPVMMVFGAFGVFVGAGHAAVLSIKLGEGDRTACEKILGELLALKLLFFFVLPPLVFVFLDVILRWTGGASVTPGASAMHQASGRASSSWQRHAHATAHVVSATAVSRQRRTRA